MWRNNLAELFIGQNSVVRAFGRPQPNREFAEVDRLSHSLDLYLPCRLRPAETDERIKALSYQLHNMLVHQVFLPIYLIEPILVIKTERLFHVCYRRGLETNSVAVEVESAAGRRLSVFRDGLRERVAGLFKRIFACDGLRVPVKELALAVDV
jgi:hypothetical protein